MRSDRGDELARDSRLAHRMAGIGHDDVGRLGPSARQRVRGDRRADDVVASLNDRARQVAYARESGEERALVEKRAVHEIVRFDARDRERRGVAVELSVPDRRQAAVSSTPLRSDPMRGRPAE
jgi:hypothetical protein